MDILLIILGEAFFIATPYTHFIERGREQTLWMVANGFYSLCMFLLSRVF